MSDSRTDVLIVGAGASASAFAWSLADTRMKIVCLEQGDWVNPADYPSGRMDWESDNTFNSNPNHRANAADYPINCSESPIAIVQLQRRRRRHHPLCRAFSPISSFGFQVQDAGWCGRRLAHRLRTLEPFYDENDRMMGVSGSGRGSGLSAEGSGDAPDSSRSLRARCCAGLQRARLALVAFGHGHSHANLTMAATNASTSAPAGQGCAQGAKASTDVTYWPHAIEPGCKLRTRAGCGKSRPTNRSGNGCHLLRQRRR